MAYVIGIAGGSAGGKSTFSEKLRDRLTESGLRTVLISMDSFFKPEAERPFVLSPVGDRYHVDDNCPDTIDWDGYHAALTGAEEDGADVVICEGLLTLWDREYAEKFDLRLFVDCRADERIVRRLKRNMGWGLSFDEISEVYLDMVRFRHDAYVEPTKWNADLIVNGSGDTDKACEMCIGYIRRHFDGGVCPAGNDAR